MASPSRQGHISPASSPRLPSPPPFPEVQIGPRSPSPSTGGDVSEPNLEKISFEQSASRRIRPGTKAADMASGPPLIPLSELDSPFQLQEHLKALYLDATRSEQNNTTVPITRETATILATPPDNVDRSLWLYELCRFLVQKANSLIVGFFSDNPPCSAKDCPEMRASEWQYLCAVHDPPKSCCAIDYCCHTLDWAANILTSQKHFPSRLTLGGDAPGGSQASVRQLTNIFRRVYRMFAHAWFQHKDVFWTLENQEGIYIFYKTVCDIYQLIPEENYTIPPEAEGLAVEEEHQSRKDQGSSEYTIQQRRTSVPEKTPVINQPDNIEAQTTISTGATTRRHKHTPSTGSFVTTIHEGDEEGEESRPLEPVSETMAALNISQPEVSAPGPEKPSASNEAPPKLEANEAAESNSPTKEEPPIEALQHTAGETETVETSSQERSAPADEQHTIEEKADEAKAENAQA